MHMAASGEEESMLKKSGIQKYRKYMQSFEEKFLEYGNFDVFSDSTDPADVINVADELAELYVKIKPISNLLDDPRFRGGTEEIRDILYRVNMAKEKIKSDMHYIFEKKKDRIREEGMGTYQKVIMALG